MRCTIARMKISGARERNGAIDKDSADHLEACAACRHFLSGQVQMAGQTGNRQNAMEMVDPHLHKRVMAAVYLAAESHTRRSLTWSASMFKVIVPLAAAASLVIAVTLFPCGRAGDGSDTAWVAASAQEWPLCVRSYGKAIALVKSAVTVPVDTPYENELANIKNDLAAAGNFIGGCYGYASVLE